MSTLNPTPGPWRTSRSGTFVERVARLNEESTLWLVADEAQDLLLAVKGAKLREVPR